MKLVSVLLALGIAIFATDAPANEEIMVTTPRGTRVEVIVQKPQGEGPFPAVVLAAGAGYHMRLPIIEQVARALLEEGIAVFRFDWSYRVAGTDYAAQPKDRSAEVEDMQTVVALASIDKQVNPDRIAIAGKSLGSIVTWRVFRSSPRLRSAILLTPPCSMPTDEAAQINFPGLAADPRPRLWVLGDSDPLCATVQFHRHIAAGGQADRTAVINGHHDFSDPEHPERNKRALELVALLAADFAATTLTPAADVPATGTPAS